MKLSKKAFLDKVEVEFDYIDIIDDLCRSHPEPNPSWDKFSLTFTFRRKDTTEKDLKELIDLIVASTKECPNQAAGPLRLIVEEI